MKYEIDDIPYQYLRFSVRIVICIVGKLSICNKFWIEEKNYRQLKHAQTSRRKIDSASVFLVSHASCLLALLLDKACSKITASFFIVELLSLATVIPKNM